MSTNFSGYPEKSKYKKSLEKYEKEFPTLVKNIKYNTKKKVYANAYKKKK
jgi:hypothetical protein